MSVPLRQALIVAFFCVSLAGCRSENGRSLPSENRMEQLERTLGPLRTAETLVGDVETWIVRASSGATAAEKERVDAVALSLRSRLARVKPLMARAREDRESARLLAQEVDDLSDAYDRGVAAVASERRAAEESMVDGMAELVRKVNQFRVEIASAGVQGNAEARRRSAQLELSRREAAQTLVELRRASSDQWAFLRRRWKAQVRQFDENYRIASERLPLLPAPPSPTPAEQRKEK
jgi:hypothetical protein